MRVGATCSASSRWCSWTPRRCTSRAAAATRLALVGNSAYRRYLKTPDDKHFETTEKRVAEDARYDGFYVLRTNMRLDALAVMLRYRELLKVEDIFRTAKSILDTRPIYHQTDEAIRGHVFCSFLALVLRKVLEDRLAAAHLKPEWDALIRQLDRLQEIETEQDDKHFVLRTPVTGDVGRVFQAVGAQYPRGRCRGGCAGPVITAGDHGRPRRGKRGANNRERARNYLISKRFVPDGVKVGPGDAGTGLIAVESSGQVTVKASNDLVPPVPLHVGQRSSSSVP